MNQTVAVVVTYNRLDMLKTCIEKLKDQTVSCDILLIDNASTDGTEEWVRGQQGIQYHNTGKNIGGAGGFNAGMRLATEKGYKNVWVMDDDCFPSRTALEEFEKADAILDDYGWLAGVVLWTDGKECRMNRPRISKEYHKKMELLPNGLILAEQATFVSLFLRTVTIKEAGLPIKEFFIWGDDIEFTRRIAKRIAKPSYMATRSVVIHAMRSNSGSDIATDSMDRLNRYKLAFRNESYLYRQEGVKGFMRYIGRCGKNGLRILFKAKNHKLVRCGVIISSFCKGFFFNPRIERIE